MMNTELNQKRHKEVNNLWEVECCICGKIAKSPYSVIKHLDNGMSRIYEGHKGCLSLVDVKLNQGESLKFTEYDRTKLQNFKS